MQNYFLSRAHQVTNGQLLAVAFFVLVLVFASFSFGGNWAMGIVNWCK